MLAKISIEWLVMAFGAVSVLSFMLSLGLNVIIGKDGFGPFGTMFILTGGFFGSIAAANWWGIRMVDMQMGVFTGVAGAFLFLFTLLMLKALAARI